MNRAACDRNLNSSTEIAAAIGVSTTQVWRASLSPDDPRYNKPGAEFIAGVVMAFGSFERFFFLDKVIRGRISK
ncbi:MAG: hypothetical protein J7559_02935 [Cohnella sp.]|nr:hypothetical protein [Cohnella sp.]